MSGEAGRAIVLDLDNTLWGGVIGDDGLSGIRLGQNSAEGEAYATFQKFILELKRRGVVVTVCSKNNDEIAREPFKTHPDMVLREDDIAVFQSNWNDKATNIKAIGDKLGLGLKSLVFIDDNPAERERVRQELPLVAVPEIGDDPTQFVSRICKSGVFDHVLLNVDDLGRALSYEARAKAAEICAVVGNYEEYLASLRMKMTIARFDKIGRPRITQLISKSNQFNLTTLRLNEEQVRAIEEDPSRMCWQVRLDDRFSTHGIIAIVIVHKSQSEWRIESWLQSCRILERGVEQTLMNEIMRAAAGAAVTRVVGTYIPTDRNAMVEQFYPKLGFTRGSDGVDEAGVQYECNPSGYRTLPSFMEVLHL
ncbi:MAG: hypothetical protein B7Y80_18640 [Hyphomicrobium sp. 32-62-53]|nr:MAG: hypothetical protein B7Z29_19725 [Hyphomicrobium sp. 12-62-95]OYX97771.1 MAG: hypothetical protein B7Y80_18640 [Hyphomicrobium sp. 32-62-53]